MSSTSNCESSLTDSDALIISKDDSILGLNKKQVILENSLLSGGETNLNLLEKTGTHSAGDSSLDFIVNERSDMPQNNYSTKRKRADSPDSCCVNLDNEEESFGSSVDSEVEDTSPEEKLNELPKASASLIAFDPTIDMNLPHTVSLLTTPDGGKVYVVGTAHFSMESQEDVAKIIQAVQPHIVLVELCKSRVNILQLDEKTILEEAKNINFEKLRSTIRQNGVVHGLMYILLLSMSADLTKQLGMAPGGEFRRAFAEARRVPMCLIHLGDRPIHITLQRAFASLSWWQTIRLMWYLLTSKEPIRGVCCLRHQGDGLDDEGSIALMMEEQALLKHLQTSTRLLRGNREDSHLDIPKEEVERCKRRDLLEEMLSEMAGEFPALGTVFVNERDVFLTHSLQLAAQAQRCGTDVVPVRVVGVVGLGHVPGIVERWGKVTAEDIPPIMKVPPPTLTSRLLKLTVKASLVGLAVWGVSRILPKSMSNCVDSVRTSAHGFLRIGGIGQGRF